MSCACACACGFTDHRGEKVFCLENWMYCLTIFIVFVYPRDIHFSHTKLLFEVTTDWQGVHSKFLAKSGGIFVNASRQSQLKLNKVEIKVNSK